MSEVLYEALGIEKSRADDCASFCKELVDKVVYEDGKIDRSEMIAYIMAKKDWKVIDKMYCLAVMITTFEEFCIKVG
jgi:hypothetical protein